MRYAIQIVGDRETARDVVQETFLKLWQADRAEIEGHLAPWLFTVCRNRSLDIQRKERRMQPASQSQTESATDPGRTPHEEVERRQTVHQIFAALDSLPESQREVIRLKFQHGMSYKEISEITGLSVSNVGYQMHVGLRALRQQMGDASRRTS